MERLQIAEELNCVAESLINNNFRRVVTTCQRQGTGTMQVGPLGKIGCLAQLY